ncbi:SA1362 family protein [Ornithinibacillus halotolerans]|nr:SA1362 family protein [Ornithinibacillus halotolerans]
MKFIIYGIIGLAAVGLVMQLLTNTTGFLSNIFMTVIIGLAIFGLFYYFVLGGRNRSSDVKKYKQAVKQSKSKYAQYQNTSTARKPKQPNPIKKKASKRPSHLRVIDGNKSKNKKRVSN